MLFNAITLAHTAIDRSAMSAESRKSGGRHLCINGVNMCEADGGSPRERGVLCSLGDRAVAHGNHADSAMSSPSALKGGHITERLGNCLGP